MSASVSQGRGNLLLLISIGVVLGLLSALFPTVTGIALVLLVGTTLIAVLARADRIPVSFALLPMVAPLIVAAINVHLQVLPAFPDAAYYDQTGWLTSKLWRQGAVLGDLEHYNLRTRAYSTILGAAYTVFGHRPMLAVAINGTAYGVSAVYWTKLGKRFFNIRHSRVIPILFTLFPAGLLYTSTVLREALGVLALTLTVWNLALWLTSGRAKHAGISAFSAVLLLLLRPEILLTIGAATAVSLLMIKDVRARLAVIGVSGAILSALSLGPAVLRDRVPRYANPFYIELETLEKIRASHARRPHAYLVDQEYGSWPDVFSSLPVRAFHLLFSPFPWSPSSYSMLVATADSAFLLIVSAVSLIGLKELKNADRRVLILLAAFVIVTVAGYSLVISTPSGVRRRIYVVPVLFLFAGMGFSRLMAHVRVRT